MCNSLYVLQLPRRKTMAEGSNINLKNLPTTNWSPSEYDAMAIFRKYNCTTCDVELNSSQQYQEHIQGHSHKIKARSQEIAAKQIIDSRSNLNQVQMLSQSQDSSPDSFFDDDVQCIICNVRFTSPSHRISHCQGKKTHDCCKSDENEGYTITVHRLLYAVF